MGPPAVRNQMSSVKIKRPRMRVNCLSARPLRTHGIYVRTASASPAAFVKNDEKKSATTASAVSNAKAIWLHFPLPLKRSPRLSRAAAQSSPHRGRRAIAKTRASHGKDKSFRRRGHESEADSRRQRPNPICRFPAYRQLAKKANAVKKTRSISWM